MIERCIFGVPGWLGVVTHQTRMYRNRCLCQWFFLTQRFFRLIILRLRRMRTIRGLRQTIVRLPCLWCGAFIKEVGHASQGRLGSRCATLDGIITHVLPDAYIQVPLRRLKILLPFSTATSVSSAIWRRS